MRDANKLLCDSRLCVCDMNIKALVLRILLLEVAWSVASIVLTFKDKKIVTCKMIEAAGLTFFTSLMNFLSSCLQEGIHSPKHNLFYFDIYFAALLCHFCLQTFNFLNYFTLS